VLSVGFTGFIDGLHSTYPVFAQKKQGKYDFDDFGAAPKMCFFRTIKISHQNMFFEAS